MENMIMDFGMILVNSYLKDKGFPTDISKLTVRSEINNTLNDKVQQLHLNPDGETIKGRISESVNSALRFNGYSLDQQAKMYRRNPEFGDYNWNS